MEISRDDIYTGDVTADISRLHTHYTHITHSPVNADSTQVEDTGGAHHHIQRDKDVTVEPAEEPGPADHLQDRQEDYQRTCFSWTYSAS